MAIQQMEGPVDSLTRGFLAGQKIKANLAAIQTQALQNELLGKQVSSFEEMQDLQQALTQSRISYQNQLTETSRLAAEHAAAMLPLEEERTKAATAASKQATATAKAQEQKSRQQQLESFYKGVGEIAAGDLELKPGEIEGYVASRLGEIQQLYPYPIQEGDATFNFLVSSAKGVADTLMREGKRQDELHDVLMGLRMAQTEKESAMADYYGAGRAPRRQYLTPQQQAQVDVLQTELKADLDLRNQLRDDLSDQRNFGYDMEGPEYKEIVKAFEAVTRKIEDTRKKITEVTGTPATGGGTSTWSPEQLERAEEIVNSGRALDARFDPSTGKMMYEVPDPLGGTSWVFEENLPIFERRAP